MEKNKLIKFPTFRMDNALCIILSTERSLFTQLHRLNNTTFNRMHGLLFQFIFVFMQFDPKRMVMSSICVLCVDLHSFVRKQSFDIGKYFWCVISLPITTIKRKTSVIFNCINFCECHLNVLDILFQYNCFR